MNTKDGPKPVTKKNNRFLLYLTAIAVASIVWQVISKTFHPLAISIHLIGIISMLTLYYKSNK